MPWGLPPALARRRTWTGLITALLSAAVLASSAAAARPAPTTGAIIGVETHGDEAGVRQLLQAAGIATRPIPRIDALHAPVASADAVRLVLGHDPRVRWIEPVVTRELLAEPASAVDATTGRPFDWAYDAVAAGQALAAAGGGSSVRVAVVDSGVDATHPDLAGRIAAPIDIALGGTTAPDNVGHGTFVAGLIDAVDGNGIGGRGVAGATTVIPVRITTSGSITSANAAAGIVAAVDAGARVVNLSFGGTTISSAERAALDYAVSKDVLVVAAAGNSRLSGNPVIYPAATLGGSRGGWGSGLSVAAVDPAGGPAPFSTSNDQVSLAAPGAGDADDCGDGVFSTIPQKGSTLWSDGCLRTVGDLGSPTGRYAYAEGTSFAAPIVAGAAALVRGVNPRLTAAQTADVLRRTAHQTLGTGWNARTGVGVIDMDDAVALARRYDLTPPTPVIAAVPQPDGVGVTVTVKDAAIAGAEQSPLVSIHVETSADGATFTPLAPDGAGIVRATDAAAPGSKRWYRATACDASRNCGTASAGPVTAGAATLAGRATSGPALSAVVAGRPKRCRSCLRVAFTLHGPGPIAWTAEAGGASRSARRAGAVKAARRVTTTLPLKRVPVCGGRITVTVRLRSALGQAHASRSVAVTGRCLRRWTHHRRHRHTHGD